MNLSDYIYFENNDNTWRMVYKYIVAFPILLFASQFFYMTSVFIPKVKHNKEEFDT